MFHACPAKCAAAAATALGEIDERTTQTNGNSKIKNKQTNKQTKPMREGKRDNAKRHRLEDQKGKATTKKKGNKTNQRGGNERRSRRWRNRCRPGGQPLRLVLCPYLCISFHNAASGRVVKRNEDPNESNRRTRCTRAMRSQRRRHRNPRGQGAGPDSASRR